MRSLRNRLTYANVMSTLAVFLVLGGSAVAASTLNGRSITRGSISGSKLKHNTLTSRQVSESRLTRVPRAKNAANATKLGGVTASRYLRLAGKAQDAERLDGLDSTAFAQGQGVTVSREGAIIPSGAASAFTPLITVPRLGTVSASCSDDGHDVTLRYISSTQANQLVSQDVAVQPPATGEGVKSAWIGPGANIDVPVTGLGDPGGIDGRLGIVRDVPAADSATVQFSVVAQSTGIASRCAVTATAVSG